MGTKGVGAAVPSPCYSAALRGSINDRQWLLDVQFHVFILS